MRTQLTASLVIVFASFSIVSAQEEANVSKVAATVVSDMRKEILAEIKKLEAHEWAGVYYGGDGVGANASLAISPESGFAFQFSGCLGIYERNCGRVLLEDSTIYLLPKFENKERGLRRIATELVPVAWGDRMYLIPADEMIKFCNSVNQNEEPRNTPYGDYYLRTGDEKKPARDFPNVPEEFKAYLLATPIEAKIIAVGDPNLVSHGEDWRLKETKVELNEGLRIGLRVGMELYVASPRLPRIMFETIKISKVDESSSEAVVIQSDDDTESPQVGWQLTTQSPWRRRGK